MTSMPRPSRRRRSSAHGRGKYHDFIQSADAIAVMKDHADGGEIREVFRHECDLGHDDKIFA